LLEEIADEVQVKAVAFDIARDDWNAKIDKHGFR
jgi:hypothetical protein